MINLVLISFLLLFVVLGICDLIYIIRLLFYFPKTLTPSYSFIVLKKGFAFGQLNFIWQKIKWYGDEFAVGIIAITDQLDENELLKCKRFVADKNILLLSINEN